MSRSRLIDWKFLAMLTVMLLATVACWGFVARQKQVNALIEIGQRSTEQVRTLSAKVDAQAAEAETARVKASNERDALLKQNRKLGSRIDALTNYLRAHGLSVPDAAPTPPPPPKHQTPSGASPKPKPRTPSPRPTPTPDPDPGPICTLAPLLCP